MLKRVIAVEPLFSASDAGSPESALEGAHFASPEQGAVVLSGNDVRVTNDGGKSWGKPGEVDWILDDSLSKYIRSTTDDHPTFIEVTDKEQTGMSCVTSTFFLDERNGWFSRDVIPDVDTEVGDEPGYSDIGKTEDRGKNWRVVSTLPGVRIFDLAFLNKDTGFLVGELPGERGVALWTEDGCRSWSFIFVARYTLLTVIAINESQLFVGGIKGGLYNIWKEGRTYRWKRCKVRTKDQLLQFAFKDENHGLCLGEDNLILETRDGGEKWAQARLAGLQPQCNIHRIFFVQDHLYLQSDQVLYLARL